MSAGADHTERLKKALVALQKMQERVDALERAAKEPIAVVGIGCRFPGGADSPDAFWRLLAQGYYAVAEIPSSRWSLDHWYDPDPERPGKMYTRHAALVDGIDRFDAHFFGMAPREAVKTDPQHRLLLEVAWEALEHAGIAPDRLTGSPTGVFVGMTVSDYETVLHDAGADIIDAYHLTGSCLNFAAGRLAYTLGLQGPTMVIDSACSSSLVAVHLACRSLQSRECTTALAGGVNVILSPELMVTACKARMLSPTGTPRTFDAAADGFVRGEGCGVIVLRRLRDAIADGDTIWAVIRGSAVNQDGPSSGLTVPNRHAQEQVIRDALARAGVTGADIDYVEAHGTATPLGDPIEVRALGAVLGQGRSPERKFLLGSVKTNIGHLESAAGIAGLIKTILAIRHGAVPPHLHLQTPNPRVEWSEIPARIPTSLTPWPAVDRSRLAGVSSFGASGTNAHIIVEEAPAAAAEPVAEGPFILPISAKTPEALREAAAAWRDALRQPDVSAADLCYTAAHGRAHLEQRLAVVGDSPAALADACGAFLSGQARWDVVTGHRRRAQERPVFVFSGQGPQWWAMGRELLSQDGNYRRLIEQISEILAPMTGWSLVAELTAPEAASRLAHTEVAQPALFALQTALAEVWKHWGVIPAAVVGHSVGEIAAAHAAGVLDLESAVRVAFHRGRLMQRATGLGRMAAVGLSRADAEQLTARFAGALSVAAVNGPASVTLAGTANAINEAIDELTTKGIFCRLLQVDYAFHTEQMAPHAAELVSALAGLRVHPARVPLISTVTGKEARPEDYTAQYWNRNVRQAVLFAPAIAELAARGHSVFLEIGPHPVLTSSIEQSAESVQPVVAASLVRGRPERATLLAAAGTLHSAGCVVDWTRITPKGRRVPAPTYRWQRERYWVEAARSSSAQPADDNLNPTPVRSPFVQGHVFEWVVAADRPSYLADHRIHDRTVLPATVFIDMALSGASRVFDGAPAELADLLIMSPLVLDSESPRPVQLQVQTPVEGCARFSLMSADRATDGTWTLHVEGSAAPAAIGRPATLELDRIKTDCTEHVTAAGHYHSLDEHGLSFGERFQTVREIWRREGEALADVHLGRAAGTPAHGLHPVLVDGCIQALWAAVPRDQRSAAEGAWVPVSCARLHYHCPSVPDRVMSHVRIVAGSAESGAFTADLTIALPDGSIVASLSGIRIQRVREASVLGSSVSAQSADWWHRVEWIALPAEGPARPLRGRWLVFDDGSNEGAALTSLIAAEGGAVIQVRSGAAYARSADGTCTVDPANAAHFERLLAEVTEDGPLRAVLHMWSLTAADAAPDNFLARQQRVCGSLLHYIKAHGPLSHPAAESLILVTRGACPAGDSPVQPAQAPAWGLMTVAALEHPELNIACVDLDPASAFDAQQLVAELRAPAGNQQVALRRSGRYAARLRKTEAPRRPAETATRLEIPQRGTLENLRLVPVARRAPGPGEIEIRVRASGVNFRDVLNTLGMYPGEAGLLGSECVGEVERVGEGVRDLAPGDRVIAVVQGAFSSHVTTLAALAARAPRGLSDDELATLPIAFLTAHCALHELAKMKRGDRVLIHAAAGGVGLAAVQLARRAGAEIFATAGSAEKHDYLRSLGVTEIMSSRSLDFFDQVMAATGGRGVDIVLNSLAGEFIPRSLAALAANGRFVELGKTGIWTTEQVAAVRPDVSYHAFYLGELLDADPGFGNRLLRALVADVESGALGPLPVRSFPVAEAAAAFRHMAQARHIGKVVLTQPVEPPDGSPQIRPAAEYLITGGLGALGLAIAEGLAERGARHLTLVGRRAPSAEAAARIARLESRGVQVRTESADIADASAVDALLRRIDASGVPLAGIVHAAGVLEDGALMQQTWDRFEAVLLPKALGAWHLHRATAQRPLDFFVLFSSLSSVIGSAGQGNYAAANAYLDALAHARRAEGLPAASINWGPWASAGMAAELGTRRLDDLRRQGVSVIPVEVGVSLFFDLLRETSPQTAILPIDWRAFGAARPESGSKSLLADLVPKTTAREARSAPQSWKDRLLAAAPAQRLDSLMKLVAQETCSVLALPDGFVLDYQQGLREVGLDSLMAVELRNRLQARVGVSLPATLVFDFPTVAALARHLASVMKLDLSTPAPRSHAARPDEEIAALTDDEAEALLRDELALLQQMRRGK